MIDLLVSFNRHASSVGLKQHRHSLYHMIFLYIKIRLAMTSKIAARALKYELESPSYGDSKLQK